MDYWEYLAHGQGSERRGHRYYARELIGNKNGKNVYRYFYTADEYSAYKQNKGTPGRGTYAETGTSRSAIVWPKNTSRKRKATEARNSVEQQKSAMDRERARTSVRAQKVQMDAKRYRKQQRERMKANRIAQQHTMDRERWKRNEKAEQAKNRGDKHKTRVQEAIREKVHKDAVAYRRKRAQENIRAEKVQMDAKRYRKQRRQEKNDARNELKKKMDRDRIRTSIRAQKVKMDAKRYRRQKREMLKQKRAGQKRIMDNIRQRPYYQPTIKRGR